MNSFKKNISKEVFLLVKFQIVKKCNITDYSEKAKIQRRLLKAALSLTGRHELAGSEKGDRK
jgi:hypothetical protein